MKKSKTRSLFLQIEKEELLRVLEESLGHLFIEIIITHANVKINVKTDKQKKIKFSRNNLLENV